MENNFILSIEWKNADIYFPELENGLLFIVRQIKRLELLNQ